LTRNEADRRRIISRVRYNAWSAGIAAALMLYFGFIGSFSIPEKGLPYTLACRAFVYTLQGGGVLMALAAVLCLVGIWQTLYFDAFVSALIGIALVLSAVVQVVYGDFIAVLYGVFGIMFVRSAIRNYGDAGEISALESDGARRAWQDEPPPPPERSAGSELRSKMKKVRGAGRFALEPMRFEPPAQGAMADGTPRIESEGSAESPVAPADSAPAPPPAAPADQPEPLANNTAAAEPKKSSPPQPAPPEPGPEVEPPSGPPPPGGFLAALAKEDDDQE
jgi:hypothetical protein